jgi:nucleotide-binding universal stress UspA family protein
MYTNIMVPTDGSGFDREAILVALRVAERCHAKIRLVRVLGTGAYFGMASSTEGVIVTEETIRLETEAALGELYALAAECRTLSTATISADLEHGPIADMLAAYARRNEVDLIVISSHGRRGIARLALGSVTDLLIRQTTIPVLVVKPKASYLTPEASKEFHNIVVPLDGSGLAEQILTRVVPLAKAEEADITLLHVLAPEDTRQTGEATIAPWWEKKVASARAYLTHRAAEIRRQGVAVRIDVIIGENAADAITDYARRERADLIAIATHGRRGLARVLRGSVADGVTKSAMSSILVFHPDLAVADQESGGEEFRKARQDSTAFA